MPETQIPNRVISVEVKISESLLLEEDPAWLRQHLGEEVYRTALQKVRRSLDEADDDLKAGRTVSLEGALHG